MKLFELQRLAPCANDIELSRLRNRMIDEYIASIEAEELAALRELVALEHEKGWAKLGPMIRKADPKTSPVVRQMIFESLPCPRTLAVSSAERDLIGARR